MKLSKTPDYLTNDNYLKTLEFIGLAERPMLPRDIRKKLLSAPVDNRGKTRQNISYLYDMLRTYLAPSSYKTMTIRLLQWKKYPVHGAQMKKFISRLNLLLKSLYGSKIVFEEPDKLYFNKDKELNFESVNDNVLVISQKFTPELSIIIRLNDGKSNSTLSVFLDGKAIKTDKLLIKRNKGRIYLYVVAYIPLSAPIRFLSATKFPLNDKRTIDAIIKEIRKSPLTPDTQKNEFELLFALDYRDDEVENRQLCQYRLNIRGLLAFILKVIDEEKGIGRELNSRISRLLRNLSKNFVSDFPFLLNYCEFEKEYNTLGRKDVTIKNFPVQLIKQIAIALRYFVFTLGDIKLLMYLVILRFSEGVLSYLTDRELKHLSIDKVIKYKARNLFLIMEYLTYAWRVKEADYNQVLARLGV